MTDIGARLYLELLKRVLTNSSTQEGSGAWWHSGGAAAAEETDGGLPMGAQTMIGLAGLDNVQACVERALADAVPGDLMETGVWRGGVCVFMRGVLKAHGSRTGASGWPILSAVCLWLT